MSGEESKQKGEEGRKDEMREGDWMCAECSSHNYNARVTCYRCTLPKERSEVMLKGKSALDWECFQCKATNFSWRHECFKCHITREGSDDMKARQVGVDWFCRFCDLKNFPNRSDCFKCKRNRDFCDSRRRSPPRGMQQRGPSPRRSPPRMRRPSPPRRRMSSPPRRGRSPPHPRRSRSPIRRRMPASPPPRRMTSPRPAPLLQDEEWRCGLCGTMNGCRRNDCYKCTSPKGNPNSNNPGPSLLGQVFGDDHKGPAAAKDRDGSWDCPDCHIKNYHFRNECFKCKTVKPDELNKSQNNPTAMLNHSGINNKGLLSTPVSKPGDYYEPESPPKRNEAAADTTNNGIRQQFGPDWLCKFCKVDIFPTRNDCYKCGRTRDECDEGNPAPAPGPPLIPDRPEVKEGYTCGCGTFNRCDEATCNWCGKPNPGNPSRPSTNSALPNRNQPPPNRNQPPPNRNHFGPLPKVDWDCGDCRINNFHYRTDCFKCKKPRDQCEETRPSGWAGEGPIERRNSPRRGDRRERTPPRRPALLDRHNVPRSRFSPPPFRAGGRGRSRSPPRRGFSPPPRRGRSPPRRDFRSPPRGTGKQYQPDWECRECEINNFVKRAKCFRCGKDRAEVELLRNADGKPIGPNDWLCPKCNGHNFSRRDTCYKCKTEKPSNKRKEEDKRDSGAGAADEDHGGDDLDMEGNMDRVEIDAM